MLLFIFVNQIHKGQVLTYQTGLQPGFKLMHKKKVIVRSGSDFKLVTCQPTVG